MSRLKILIVLGTRPEAIKLAPLIHELKTYPNVDTMVCSTGQHSEMLSSVLGYFGIELTCDLKLMQPNQSLSYLISQCAQKLDEQMALLKPDVVVLQGDTTTGMTAALVAFNRRIPVVHVEAGLRTGTLRAPWPEEFNRRVISLATMIHCAPTDLAAMNLRDEKIPSERIHVTGNTVIDALFWTLERESVQSHYSEKYEYLGKKRLILITLHRRESFGPPFHRVCVALLALSRTFPDDLFLYPVHPNPNVFSAAHSQLSQQPNIRLLPPVPYPEFVWLMNRSYLILSDSGGIQEEAPSLKKPLLILREVTERPEAIAAGSAVLVGRDSKSIFTVTQELLLNPFKYRKMQAGSNPFGDGTAAKKIANLIISQAWHSERRKAA